MENRQLDFKPLEFIKTQHADLRPPMFDGDGRTGDDYARGKLLSLNYAKNSVLLVALFAPGPDAKSISWEAETGIAELLMVKRNGRYVGTITSQDPKGFLQFTTRGEVIFLDGLGHGGTALGGREAAHFFCSIHVPYLSQRPNVTVSVYIGLGWFGRWKEIVVELPRKELYVAYL